jgi:hypothetical protein
MNQLPTEVTGRGSERQRTSKVKKGAGQFTGQVAERREIVSPSSRSARDNTGLERGRGVEGDADSDGERVNHPNQTRMARPDFNLTSSVTVEAEQTQSGDREAEGVNGIKDKDTNVVPLIFPSTKATCAPELASDQKKWSGNQKRAARRRKRGACRRPATGDREADGAKGTRDMDTNVVPRISPSTQATCAPESQSVQSKGSDNAGILRPLNPEAAPFVPAMAKGELGVGKRTQIAAVELGAGGSTGGRGSLYVTGQLEGTKVRFLVDTGAERSVMGAGVLASLPEKVREAFRMKSCNLLMANQQREVAPGPVVCQVMVEGRTVLEPFCVLKDMEGAILGMPALCELGLEVTVAGVDLLPRREEAQVRRLATAQVCQVKLLKDVDVPARSEHLVLAKTSSGLNGKPVMIAPSIGEGGTPNSLLVARTVGTPVASTVVVRVCNTSEKPISLKAKQVVAEAQEVQVIEGESGVMSETELPEHLTTLWRTSCERGELNESVAQQLKLLLVKYSKLFASSDVDLGRTSLIQHEIETGKTPPIRQPPRRIPGGQLPEFEAEMERMLKAGVIEPGQSPWASPVVLVRKRMEV